MTSIEHVCTLLLKNHLHTQGCGKRISELLWPEKLDVLYVRVMCSVCAASRCVLRNPTLRTSLRPYKNRELFLLFGPRWPPAGRRTMTVIVLDSCLLRVRHNACAHPLRVLQVTLRELVLLALWRERA